MKPTALVMQPSHTIKTQHGFTLVEVLIALVILGVGLLGLAGLQTASLRAGDDAYLRTQASIYAYNLIDRMRANPTVADKYAIPVLTSVSTLAAAYNIGAGAAPAAPTGCGAAPCNPDALAKWDSKQWITNLSALPGSQVQVTIQTKDNSDYVTIKLQWNEKQADTENTKNNTTASLLITSTV